ncbi:hypothetical protein K1T71_003847 [Dendrolimus kikuchii]|uniref:Uncharacterized protein n=1 Tax=Dendrolimus kikuchii TaxID=765133 RepID=A0ACC1D923_9NEOP|nr:hypothetical protein K1T71_003847 [Dendrolimus kikuchii]
MEPYEFQAARFSIQKTSWQKCPELILAVRQAGGPPGCDSRAPASTARDAPRRNTHGEWGEVIKMLYVCDWPCARSWLFWAGGRERRARIGSPAPRLGRHQVER